MHNPFLPGVKQQLKARIALDGPTGSGKTWTALSMAREIAGDDGRIAVIDTERGRALLYAHLFSFDHLRFEPPFDVHQLVDSLKAAEANGYAVIILDSFSHFWEGEGGVLDEVDAAAARERGNTFAGWKHGTPLQRFMVDTIIGLDLHVIVTMRSKMAYVLEEYTDSKGNKKSRPVRLGEQPVQRQGVEYEFDVIGTLDLEHRIQITKSRCELLADRIVQPHREAEAARTFIDWLDAGEPLAARTDVEALVALFDGIEERSARANAKSLFVECFGKPDYLTVVVLPEAQAWVVERVQAAQETTDEPLAGAEPSASTEDSPADSDAADGHTEAENENVAALKKPRAKRTAREEVIADTADADAS